MGDEAEDAYNEAMAQLEAFEDGDVGCPGCEDDTELKGVIKSGVFPNITGFVFTCHVCGHIWMVGSVERKEARR